MSLNHCSSWYVENLQMICWPHIAYTMNPAVMSTKCLLRGVCDVEEAVFILLSLVDLGDGRAHTDHVVLVDQHEEGLVRVQL